KELQTRWDRLSQLLDALQQQRDLETRAEERLRLDCLIAQREAERQQVATQLQEVEPALRTPRGTDLGSPLLPESPETLSPVPPASFPFSCVRSTGRGRLLASSRPYRRAPNQ